MRHMSGFPTLQKSLKAGAFWHPLWFIHSLLVYDFITKGKVVVR